MIPTPCLVGWNQLFPAIPCHLTHWGFVKWERLGVVVKCVSNKYNAAITRSTWTPEANGLVFGSMWSVCGAQTERERVERTRGRSQDIHGRSESKRKPKRNTKRFTPNSPPRRTGMKKNTRDTVTQVYFRETTL